MNFMIPNWMQSSADPAQVSATVSGTILSASALIIWIAMRAFHVQLEADDVIALSTQIGTIVGAVWALYGLIRKALVKASTPTE